MNATIPPLSDALAGRRFALRRLAALRVVGLYVALYASAAAILVLVLGPATTAGAPTTLLAAPLATFLLLVALFVLLHAITVRVGRPGPLARLLPLLFLPLFAVAVGLDVGGTALKDWAVLLAITGVALGRSRVLLLSAVGAGALVTPLALGLPLVLLPLWLQSGRPIDRLGWLLGMTLTAWSGSVVGGVIDSAIAAGAFDVPAVTSIFGPWRFQLGLPWHDPSRLGTLLPTGASIVALLVLGLLVERFVLGARPAFRRCLVAAGLAWVGLSLGLEGPAGRWLALVVAPLYLCLVDGLMRSPPPFAGLAIPADRPGSRRR